jgi:H+/gluconate symporter-like permease
MMKLIDNINEVARLWSVQVAGIGAALSAVWLALPETQQAAIIDALGLPPGALALLAFVATIAARVLKQDLPSTNNGGGPDPTR